MCLHSQTRLRSPLRSWLPTCYFLTLMLTSHLFQEVPANDRPGSLGCVCVCMHTHTCTLIPYTFQKCESHLVVSDILRPHELYSPWNYPGQNTWNQVGGCSLLQGIFPTQGLKPGLPHCRQILYQLATREACNPQKPCALFSAVPAPCFGPI